jgi:heme/copper-type cytochrome/quinol oxidase subunit 3
LEAITGLLLTLVLAVLFTSFQAYEYLNAPFNISDGIYGTTFYSLTGLHGFHVIVGTIFLSVALFRAVEHHYTRNNHIGYECAA